MDGGGIEMENQIVKSDKRIKSNNRHYKMYEVVEKIFDFKCPKKIYFLPDSKIKAIKEQASSNRTATRGYSKHPYLLSRMIFCRECGRALSGQTQKNGKHRYYRHRIKTDCKNFAYIHASLIEAEVFSHIYWMIGDKTGFEQAVIAATPNREGIEKAEMRLQQIAFELKKVTNEQDRLIDSVAEGLIPKYKIKPKMDRLIDCESLLNSEKKSLLATIENQPTKDEINSRFKGWKRILKAQYEHNPDRLLNMSSDERRQLLQALFTGKDGNGQRFGVYVRKDAGSDCPWIYEIKGSIPSINDNNRIGMSPFAFEYDDERQAYENTRDKLYKQNCARKNH